MKIRKYTVGALLAVGLAISCSPDPNLYPLPYDDRETGSYLRAYRVSSNTWDLDDFANSGFEVVYESVDKAYGANLDKIEFYATHRQGTTGFITDEVLVKTYDAAQIATLFAKVPAPTYSEYTRSQPIRVTHTETLAALNTLTADPDGTTGVGSCTGIYPKVCPAQAFPLAGLVLGDRILFRIAITDKQGRLFTVANPQATISPSLGNPNEANITANLTGGLFYASPMLFTTLIQRTTTTGNPNAYTGTYTMTQVARWQPDHTAAQHQSFPQAWIDQFAFGNPASTPVGSDSSQTVTLSKVTGSGGLATEREFTCMYRGTTITMRINLEMAVLNQTGAGLSAAAITTLNTLPPNGFGFPGGTTNTNLGTVYVPLMNSTVDCTSVREFYMATPLGGTFPGVNTLPWGLPRSTVPNRGAYRLDRDGLTVGDTFSIGVDDDCDEYDRRNGYCNWYTRIQLTLTKQ